MIETRRLPTAMQAMQVFLASGLVLSIANSFHLVWLQGVGGLVALVALAYAAVRAIADRRERAAARRAMARRAAE